MQFQLNSNSISNQFRFNSIQFNFTVQGKHPMFFPKSVVRRMREEIDKFCVSLDVPGLSKYSPQEHSCGKLESPSIPGEKLETLDLNIFISSELPGSSQSEGGSHCCTSSQLNQVNALPFQFKSIQFQRIQNCEFRIQNIPGKN